MKIVQLFAPFKTKTWFKKKLQPIVFKQWLYKVYLLSTFACGPDPALLFIVGLGQIEENKVWKSSFTEIEAIFQITLFLIIPYFSMSVYVPVFFPVYMILGKITPKSLSWFYIPPYFLWFTHYVPRDSVLEKMGHFLPLEFSV